MDETWLLLASYDKNFSESDIEVEKAEERRCVFSNSGSSSTRSLQRGALWIVGTFTTSKTLALLPNFAVKRHKA
jgi:hypothetical protein